MFGESKKLHLIEEIIKIENESLLEEVESVITKGKQQTTTGKGFKDFAGIWTEKEADEISKIIEDNCEQINPDDWK